MCYILNNALPQGDTNEGEGTYYPARRREGLTVFMMGSIMLEYNRKPLQIPGGPSGKVLQLVLILLYSGEEGVHREELLDMLYGNGECSNPSGEFTGYGIPAPQAFGGSELPPREYTAQTEESTGGMARNCRCILMPGILRIRQGGPAHTHDEALLKRACGLYQGKFLAQLARREMGISGGSALSGAVL